MPVKCRLEYLCPGCRSSEVRQTTGRDRFILDEPYNGAWLECLACGMQGPKPVWDEMRNRRRVLHEALNLNQLTPNDRAYLKLIEDFGQKMYRELKANEPRKGNFLDWKPDRDSAVSELEHHVVKLIAAISQGKKTAISEFAADIGNVAMSIDKNLGTT